MYELIQVGKKTYYIECPAKMGLYKLSETEVCLIDSGNNKDAAKKVLALLNAQNWTLTMVINTHSHADHIGGNQLLQQRTGCVIYAAGMEAAFTQFPILEPSFLYGGYPCKELRNKFLCAQGSEVTPLTEAVLPDGLQMLPLDGHSFAMIGLKTEDDIWFLADCLTNEAILEKYHIPFLYDVAAYIATLHSVKNLQGKLFIPAHAAPLEDISALAQVNLAKVEEILQLLTNLCAEAIGFDALLKALFDHYGLAMDFNQHVLVGSTIRSYLAYLYDKGEVQVTFAENTMLWKTSRDEN